MNKNKQIFEIISDLEKILKENRRGSALVRDLKSLLSKECELGKKNIQENKISKDVHIHIPKELAGKKDYFALFSDGACRGNPGPGAWASCGILPSGELIFEKAGLDVSTTNNRMELEGAINALSELLIYHKTKQKIQKSVYLFTDSTYVVNGVSKWISGWKSRGWKKADGRPPLNLELWQELDQLTSSFSNLSFEWVRGHAGHYYNEKCDQMANEALDDAGF